MKLTIQFGQGVFALPEALLGYIDKASPLALKLFLELAADRELLGDFDVAAFAKRFAVTPKEAEDALAFWQNAGLLACAADSGTEQKKKKKTSVNVSVKRAENGESVTVVTSDRLPNYTGSEIETIMEGNAQLAQLIDECQRIAGKVFGAHELNRVIAMADILRLDNGAILLLFGYAASIGKCSVNYVVKIAQSLANDGLTSYAEVEAYIAAKEKVHTVENLIRRLSGIGARALSAKEKRFVDAWSEYDFAEDILTLAYEITVNNIGEFAFPYMNKILVNWNEAGYRTRSEVEEALKGYRDKKASGEDTSFDVDEFFEAALKRSQNRPVGTGN